MVCFNAGNRTGIADDFDTVWMEENLRWLHRILAIGAVVNRVYERLPKGDLRITYPTAYLIAIPVLLQVRVGKSLKVAQATPDLIREWSPKDAFVEDFPRSVRSKPHDFDSGPREPLGRVI